MAAFQKNQIVDLTIEGYGTSGEGIAHLPDNMACFVAGGLRGEVCAVRLDKVGRSAAWGHVERVLTPSPARLKPDCPYYVNCGGCATRHMTYAEELEFKRQKVADCVKRIGGCDTPVEAICGAKEPERYRNKVQFPAAGGKIGFYAARTHSVTDVADCLLQPESAARIRSVVKDFMSTYHVTYYDEKTGKGLLRHLYVRSNRAGETLVCLLVNGKALPHEEELVAALRQAEPGLRGVVLGVNLSRSNVILGESYRTLWGEDHLMDTLCGLEFRLSVPSFYQVNPDQTEVLYGLAVDYAGLTGTETVLDLYCGIGTITLCLARKAKQAIGAEVVPQAIEDAKANALRNGLHNTEFFCGDAGEVAQRFAREGVRPDVITVDPPRKGLAAEVVEAIAGMAPARVVYVSCDPATLARDIARFAEQGYQPQKITAVDLFPRTHHVETVCLLTRTGGGTDL